MSDFEQSRRDILQFLETPKGKRPIKQKIQEVAEHSKTMAPIAGALAENGLRKIWDAHPLKDTVDQALPLAEDAIRRKPLLSVGIAGAIGALWVLSPRARQKTVQLAQQHLPLPKAVQDFFKP